MSKDVGIIVQFDVGSYSIACKTGNDIAPNNRYWGQHGRFVDQGIPDSEDRAGPIRSRCSW